MLLPRLISVERGKCLAMDSPERQTFDFALAVLSLLGAVCFFLCLGLAILILDPAIGKLDLALFQQAFHAGFGDGIRLDVGTSAGPVLGSLLFEGGRMLLVLPQERTAYTGEASKRNLRRMLGLPLPFDMQGLHAFLAGDILAALDAPLPERYEIENDGNIIYRWRKGVALCELELSPQALPVRWTSSDGWDMEITCGSDGLPVKLSGRMDSGEDVLRLILLVKERRPVSLMQAPSLSLTVPAGFDVRSID